MAQNRHKIEAELVFSANADAANAAIDCLTEKLKNISNFGEEKLFYKSTKQFSKINQELSLTGDLLSSSFDSKVGRLDVTKFATGMKAYGLNFKDVSNEIKNFAGQDVFDKFNESIVYGTTGLGKMKGLIGEMGAQMARTIKLETSYAIFNALTGSISSAYNYAKDLNESLNNIRIVTGQTSDQMASFAKNANKAAQALSTTTTSYTDAALIYYQQGLSDEEVEERTNATIKMANASGQSASEVSSQMTAIWNNFDDGSKSLEYYGDVITKLGASTASSSEEIASGLQQFAAVSDTVGLSYEHASAALAAVVAQTRQSADTVGNSFKTIFARLESLNMGDTLDDDTTLTKYTEALAKAGVNIKLGNGELKSMDNILDELGAKWSAMNQEQKNSLAYTVAGARQYTNFIALMDNYDEVLKNVDIAETSEGTLNEQQEIYAESWEAASKRVRAAWEEMYSKILDDDFFIALTNGAADFLSVLNKIIDGVGGLPSVLGLLLPIINTIFSDQITRTMTSMVTNIATISTAMIPWKKNGGKTDVQLINEIAREEMNKKYKQNLIDTTGLEDPNEKEQAKIINNTAQEKRRSLDEQEISLIRRKNSMSEEQYRWEARLLEKRRESLDVLIDSTNELAQQKVSIEKSAKENTRLMKQSWLAPTHENQLPLTSEQQEKINKILETTKRVDEHSFSFTKLSKGSSTQDFQNYYNETKHLLEHPIASTSLTEESYERLANSYGEFLNLLEGNDLALNKEGEDYKELVRSAKLLTVAMRGLDESIFKENAHSVDPLENEYEKLGKTLTSTAMILTSFMGIVNTATNIISLWGDETKTTSEKLGSLITSLPSAIMSIGMMTTQIKGLLETWKISTEAGFGAFLLSPGGMLAIAAAAVTIGLIVKGIQDANAAAEAAKPENVLKRLKEATQEAKTAAEEANTAYEDLNSTLEDLDSSRETIKSLTKDTAEWTKAVTENNEEVIALLKSYDLLSDKENYTIDSAGVWAITDKGKKAMEDKNSEDVARTAAIYEKALLEENKQKSENEKKVNEKAIEKELKELVKGTTRDTFDREGHKINNGDDKAIDEFYETATDLVQKATDANQSVSEYIKEKGTSDEEIEDFLEETLGSDELTAIKVNGVDEKEILKKLSDTAIQIEKNQKKDDVEEEAIKKEMYKNLYSDELKRQGYDPDAVLGDEKFIEKLDEAGKYDEKKSKWDNTLKTTTDPSGFVKKVQEVYGADTYLRKEDGQWQVYDSNGEVVSGASGNENIARTLALIESFNAAIESEEVKKDLEEKSTDASKKEYYHPSTTPDNDYYSGTVEGDVNAYSIDEESMQEVIKQDKKVQETQEKINKLNKEIEENKGGYWDEDAKAELATYNKELEKEESLLKALYVADEKLNDGYADMAGNYEKYVKNIRENSKTSSKSIKANAALKKDLKEIFDLEKELSDSFITDEVLDLIELAANGDWEALDKLAVLAEADILKQSENIDIDKIDAFDEKLSTVYDKLQALDSFEGDFWEKGAFESGNAEIDDFINNLLDAGATIQDIQDLLDAFGFEPEVEWETVDATARSSLKDGTRILVDGEEKTFTTGMEFDAKTTVKIPKFSTKKKGSSISDRLSSDNKQLAADNKAKSDGSSSKSKEKTADRYYTITKQLEKVKTQLDQISKAEDRAFGQTKVNMMDQEIERYEQLIALNEKYLEEAKAYAEKDKGLMMGYGATFDENGIITNYEEIFAAHGQEDDFATNLKNYEDSMSKIEEIQETILEERREIYDKQLEKIQYVVEYKVELDEEKIKQLDWLMKQLEDDTYDVAESMVYLTEKAALLEDQYEKTNEGLDFWKTQRGDMWQRYLNGTLTTEDAKTMTDEERKQLQEWADNLRDYYDSIKEISDEIQNKLVSSFEKFNDVIGEQASALDHLNNILNTYKSIIDLTGRQELGIGKELMGKLRQAAIENSLAHEKVATDGYNAAKKAYEEALSDPNVEEETLKQLKSTLDSMEETWITSLENTLKAAQEKFSDMLKDIVSEFEEKMGGVYGNLENLSDAFDKQNKLDDLYLKGYEQTYQLTKLMRDLDKSIDEADNTKNRQKLLELQEEIQGVQEDGTELNAYDLEILQKKYNLYLAQIALEDARAAKSQVRMTRDNEGNMSYVYTADTQAVDEATQKYDDSLYELEKTTQDRQDEMQSQMVSEWKNYASAISNLNVSDEERYELLQEYWETLQDKYSTFLDDSLSDAQWLVDELGVQDDLLINQWDETTLAYLTGFDSMENMNNNFYSSSKNMFSNLKNEYVAYDAIVDAAYTAAGLSTENFANTLENELGKAETEMDETVEKAEEFATDFSSAFSSAINEIDNFASQFSTTMEEMRDNISSTVDQISDLVETLGNLGATYVSTAAQINATAVNASVSSGDGSGSDGSGTNGTTEPDPKKTQTTTADDGKRYKLVYSTDGGKSWALANSAWKDAEALRTLLNQWDTNVLKNAKSVLVEQGSKKYNDIQTPYNWLHKYLKYGMSTNTENWKNITTTGQHLWKKILGSFDTGGYTGEWGDRSGRLAMLHEKEIVLNKQDTSNLLSAIDIIRDINNSYSNLRAYADNITKVQSVNAQEKELRQTVTINAEFPNANNQFEIQKAFEGLYNRASQYANRKI